MSILITGGLGVIGSNLALQYLENDEKVTILDIANQPRHEFSLAQIRAQYPGIKPPLRQDLASCSISNIEQYDAIIHCAASTSIPGSVIDPITDYNSNSRATFNLLEQLRLSKKKIPTFVFSSVKPYQVDHLAVFTHGDRYYWERNPDSLGISETNPLSPKEPYAANKLAQSTLAKSYAISYDLPIITARFSNLYAANAYPKNNHGWATTFAISAALDREIEIQGTGFQVRDMLFVDDIHTAVEAAFENISATQKEIFNIGGGDLNSVSVLEATKMLEKIAKKPLRIKYGPGRTNEDPIFITDHRKFSSLTGWHPKVSVEQGLTRIYDWALSTKSAIEAL